MSNTYMPISISLKDRICLIIGGGQVALRKIDTLLEYNSDITVISPEVDDKIEYYAKKGLIKLKKQKYSSPEVESFGLVISASDDEEVNKQVYDDCKERHIPVNVVDNPPLCDFIFPAVVRRDCLTVSISSDGKAPFLSGHLRYVLENIFPPHWNKLVQLAVKYRKDVLKEWVGKPDQKRRAFERFLDVDWKTLLDQKKPALVENELKRVLVADPPIDNANDQNVDEEKSE